MNGLEAIKVMMEGKLVSRYYGFGVEKELYKIIDGNVHVKFEELDDEEYQIAEEFDFDETYYEYIEPKPLIGWERVKQGEETYFISVFQGVDTEYDWNDDIDTHCFNNANYFSTKDKAEEINFKQTLFRKLQRFSDENGGTEIDWNDEDQTKFSIKYSYFSSKLIIDCYNTVQQFGQVYFASKEVARKAIELFHDDLIKYFTM